MKKPPIRYSHDRCAPAESLEAHAASGAVEICKEVARYNGIRDVEKTVAEVLEKLLKQAFTAGVRQGRAEHGAEYSETMADAVEKALRAIPRPAVYCPHCVSGRTDYGSCKECGGLGSFKKP